MANSDAPTTGWRNEKRALVIVLFSFVFLFLVGVSIRIVLATRQRMYGKG